MKDEVTPKSLFEIYKGFLIFCAVAIVISMGFLMAIRPQIDEIGLANEKIAEAETKLAVLKDKEAILRSANNATLTAQSQKLTEAIPTTINLPLILATLQKIAEETNIEIGEFSLSSEVAAVTILPVSNADKLSIFQFKVNVKGNFDDTEKFISRLIEVSPLLRVEIYKFAEVGSSMTLKSYFQPQAKAILKLESPLTKIAQAENEAITSAMQLPPWVLEEPVGTASDSGRDNPFR